MRILILGVCLAYLVQENQASRSIIITRIPVGGEPVAVDISSTDADVREWVPTSQFIDVFIPELRVPD